MKTGVVRFRGSLCVRVCVNVCRFGLVCLCARLCSRPPRAATPLSCGAPSPAYFPCCFSHTALPDVSGLFGITAAAAASVNQHLISLLFERFHLLEHLNALKRFLLLAEVCALLQHFRP